MIIDCISDLHGFCPELEGGDLLIVVGDVTACDDLSGYQRFYDWINAQEYRKKIVIAGNHDNMWREATKGSKESEFLKFEYLCDSGTEFEGLNIWGSPWTLTFPGMNPACKAFTVDTEEELEEKWKLIPSNTDILITHSPPWGILDQTVDNRNVGSKTLHFYGSTKIRPKLSVFGHIHEAYGKTEMENIYENVNYQFVNSSHVNENYQPVNKPIRIEL